MLLFGAAHVKLAETESNFDAHTDMFHGVYLHMYIQKNKKICSYLVSFC